MSGIEIVGLVLGALPLLISGIAQFSATLSTAERLLRPQRELNSLRMRINTELQLFRNTTHQLLLKITNDTDAKNLLEYPSSARWKEEEFERKLKDMLAESYPVWQQAMDNVLGAIKDIRARLNLPEDKVCSAKLAHVRYLADFSFVGDSQGQRRSPRPSLEAQTWFRQTKIRNCARAALIWKWAIQDIDRPSDLAINRKSPKSLSGT